MIKVNLYTKSGQVLRQQSGMPLNPTYNIRVNTVCDEGDSHQ